MAEKLSDLQQESDKQYQEMLEKSAEKVQKEHERLQILITTEVDIEIERIISGIFYCVKNCKNRNMKIKFKIPNEIQCSTKLTKEFKERVCNFFEKHCKLFIDKDTISW